MNVSRLHSIFYLGNKWMYLEGPVRAFAYYRNYRIDLKTGVQEEYNFKSWLDEMKLLKLTTNSKRVMHLCYELGEFFELDDVSDHCLLGIDIEYEREIIVKDFKISERSSLALKEEFSVSKKDYTKAFKQVQKHLLNGDCYQVNLTFPFDYRFNDDAKVLDFYMSFWSQKQKLSPYAHSTYIPFLNKLLLSNSPECLFQAKEKEEHINLWTMPIKGSVARPKNWKRGWQKLLNSKKDRGELYMITDLLRNDLSRISDPYSVVRIKRAPLLVPGIVHQFSLVDVNLSKATSLYEVLKALFPGGSITGAPKKSVMEIIKEVELRERSFYTGSTVFLNQKIKAASINIRTMVVDFENKKASYGAGGGVTLLSKSDSEFDEMKMKVQSFLNILRNS